MILGGYKQVEKENLDHTFLRSNPLGRGGGKAKNGNFRLKGVIQRMTEMKLHNK